jgi:hypothetical protein
MRTEADNRCSPGGPCHREAEYDKQGAIQLLGRYRVDAADDSTNTVAAERQHLVRHDLRAQAKAVHWGDIDHRPEVQTGLNVGGDRTDKDSRKLAGKFIRLHHHAWPRPAEVTRADNQHDIAPVYFHDSQS